MYDKALEQLIDAVIADGIITDQERKVVYKKAASLGIDQDEIEVYLDGRLDAFMNSVSSNSGKHGDVRVCPNCGASVSSFATKCNECGYEFANTRSTESMSLFFEKVNSTTDKEKKCELIRTFPIPNDRENLLEFLSLATPNVRKAMGPFDKDLIGWLLIGSIMILLICVSYIICRYQFAAIPVFGLPACIVFFLIVLWISRNDSVAKAWEIKTSAILNKIGVISANDILITKEAKKIVAPLRSAQKLRTLFVGIIGILTIITFYFTFLQNSFGPDVRTQISEGKYAEAEAVIVGKNERILDYSECFDNYENFMRLCIIDLCEKGEFQKAKQFIVNKQATLNSYNHFLGKDHTQNAIKNLKQIIWQYENPGEGIIENEETEEYR